MNTLSLLIFGLVVLIYGQTILYTSSAKYEKPLSKEAYASWYGYESCVSKECLTASGEVFNENRFSLACSYKFRLGTKFNFYYKGKYATAICNDRGGFEQFNGGRRLFDLSTSLFEHFAPKSKGVIKLRYGN